MCELGPKEDYPFEPFRDNPRERISYGYCFDAREPPSPTSWTKRSPSTVRIMADKKAGREMTRRSAHWYKHMEGRTVLYRDGHVGWRQGKRALDPDEDDDDVGKPDAKDYTAWWSDPPYYGE